MNRALFAVLFLATVASAQPAADKSAHADACAQLKALDAKEKSDVQGLDAQIKGLREGQLKPLEEQRKALAEQYKAQREALMDQIRPGAGSDRKAFEDSKKALSEQEQVEIKAIRDKYDAQRHALTPPKANLGCK